MRRELLIVLFTLFLVIPVFAEDTAMPPLTMPTAASNGFGGTHVAYTDNVYALLVNPAAMMRTRQKSFFNFAPSVLSPQLLYDLSGAFIDVAKGDTSGLGKAADALSRREGKVVLGFELREFPFSFAWVADGFGLALWNRTFVNANIIGTNVQTHIFTDAMLPFGFAFKIFNLENSSMDMGIALKPFARVRTQKTDKITSLIENSSELTDGINVPLIVGGTLDLGLMYRWRGLRAGFTFNDIYSRGTVVYAINGKDTNTYYIPLTMNMGLAFDQKVLFFRFTLAADWHNIRNAFEQDEYRNRNAILDFGAGFQLSLFDTVKFRIGVNEMLPSFGIGFDLGACEIDLAYYGKEFGLEPGQLSTAAAELSIAIRPDAKKRNWPWTRRSVVGLFTGVENKSDWENR